MRYLRKVLNITWNNVKDNRITHKLVWEKIKIKSIGMQIAKRRLTFMGEIMRMNEGKVLAKLISVGASKKELVADSILNYVSKIILSVDRGGNFNLWNHTAQDKLTWYILVNNLDYDQNLIMTIGIIISEIIPPLHLPLIIFPLILH